MWPQCKELPSFKNHLISCNLVLMQLSVMLCCSRVRVNTCLGHLGKRLRQGYLNVKAKVPISVYILLFHESYCGVFSCVTLDNPIIHKGGPSCVKL